MKKLLVVCFVIGCLSVSTGYGSFFIENKGQWDENVLFLAELNGMNAWITTNGIWYDFYKHKFDSENLNVYPSLLIEKYYWLNPLGNGQTIEEQMYKNNELEGHVVKMTFDGNSGIIAKSNSPKLLTYINYFRGNESDKWINNVPIYEEILLSEVFEGVDFRFYFDDGYLRYDLVVKPNTDLNKIKIKYSGQDDISINAQNELVLKTSIGEVIYKGLYAYQQNKNVFKKDNQVNCNYIINDDKTISFEVTNYDRKSGLIIDPFIFSSVFGAGDINNEHPYLAIDGTKNVYILGCTYNGGMPTTDGAYRRSGYGGGGQKNLDMILTKLSADGSQLLYMTYIGGGAIDMPRGLIVDKEGNSTIYGETFSGNYPTTEGVVKRYVQNMRNDIFITKFNSTGSNLIFSTLFGGDFTDQFASVALDDDENIYITGHTFSQNFPITENALCKERKSFEYCDMFFSILNSTATEILYSTFIIGSKIDWSRGIAVDKNKKVYITGFTYSDDFHVTDDAMDKTKGTTKNDSADAFIMIFEPFGKKLQYSSYFGGNQSERTSCLMLDNNNNICIAGFTIAEDFPTTPNAFNRNYSGGYDSFFSKFSPDGKTLLYSTFIGGSENDWIQDMAFDTKNNVYLIGAKQDLELIVSTDSSKNARDFKTTVCRISNDYEEFDYYRLLGDTILSSNFGNSIVVDEEEDIYIAGTEYWGFPVTKGTFHHQLIPKLQNGQPGSESSGGYIFACKLNFKCDDMAFEYPNFSNYTNFLFNGTSRQEHNKLKLTGNKSWEAGSVWYKDKVHIESGFTTEFSFSVNNGYFKNGKEKYIGADGLAFVIQNESPEALGYPGESIGYAGIANSFAIEFDTFRNIFPESDASNIDDPSESHVAIFCNGLKPNVSKHDTRACLATYDDCLDIVPDGRRYYVRIQYLQLFKSFQINLDTDPFFGNPMAKSMTLIGHDLSNFLNFDEGGKAWVGFTSATGIASEEHFIESWKFCPFVYYPGIPSEAKEIINQSNDLIVYPNPANSRVTIDININLIESTTIELFNTLGQKLSSTSMNILPGQTNYRHNIYIDDYPSGLYYVVISSGEMREVRSFVKW